MARSAAMKIVGDVVEPEREVEEASIFLSTLVHRASVAPPPA
jgi:LacI family transcriptional regulator